MRQLRPEPQGAGRYPEILISGGQTGIDRAALDFAISVGLECGGWCPRGRRAEDGKIPPRYPLTQTEGGSYAERTRRNVDDADGTLILTVGKPTGGTKLTLAHATENGRPCLVVDLDQSLNVPEVLRWFVANQVRVLNIAGPRESAWPGIHARGIAALDEIMANPRYPARRPKFIE